MERLARQPRHSCNRCWVCSLLTSAMMPALAAQVMLQEGRVFSCHRDRWDAIWYGELGSSAAILNAGYNIGSLMIR
jgi:hypothetical protein